MGEKKNGPSKLYSENSPPSFRHISPPVPRPCPLEQVNIPVRFRCSGASRLSLVHGSPWSMEGLEFLTSPARVSLPRVFLDFCCLRGICPCGLVPPSSSVPFISASSCCFVNYTLGCWVTRQWSYRSDRCVGFFFHLRPLGRAAAEGFSPTLLRAHWIGPELCGQGQEWIRVMRTMQVGESTLLPWWPLLQTWTCPYVSLCSSTWDHDWWLRPLQSSGMGEGGDWWSWLMGVRAEGIPKGCQGE